MPFKNTAKAKEYAKAYREKHKLKAQEYQKQYRVLNEAALKLYKQQTYKLKRFDKYGITKNEFLSNLEKQKECCAICSKPFDNHVRVYIDHCHTTGKVRGLICFHCNTGLGHFKDNSTLLQKAIDYLNDNPFNYS